MAFAARPRFTWCLRSRTLPLGDRTRLMAIINLTPDSFSSDGHVSETGLAAAIAALDAGADILDLGAESTRPNAQPISATEEQSRLLPTLEALLQARPDALVSIDTYHASTALAAAQAGAQIVNDVSGLLWDKPMAEAVQSTRCGLVLTHTRGTPLEWRTLPPLAPQEILPLVLNGLRDQLAFAQAAGVARDTIVIDPGFGFGKLGQDNFTLLAHLDRLHTLGFPILAGLSRKGFLGPHLPPHDRPTTPAHTAAILQGAHILRVHDLQATKEAARIADDLLNHST